MAVFAAASSPLTAWVGACAITGWAVVFAAAPGMTSVRAGCGSCGSDGNAASRKEPRSWFDDRAAASLI